MIEESWLDDVAAIERLDTRDTLRALATAGPQLRRALLAAEEAGVDRLTPSERPRAVLVASLGGSAIVGDVLDVLAEQGSPVPVLTRRGGPLPGWVGPLDLVIAVSQSGRAAGPVALVSEAARRGAGIVTVGASGSPLAQACARGRGLHVPCELPAPNSRTALWSLLTPVLVAADRLGLVRIGAEAFEETARRLASVAEMCRPASDAFVNPAKSLAVRLSAAVPVVLGDGPLAGVAAQRAVGMFARTARVPAMHGVLPDAAAQIVATFDGPFGADTGAGAHGGPVSSRVGDIFADPFLDAPPTAALTLLVLRAGTQPSGALSSGAQSVAPPSADALTEAVLASAQAAGVRIEQVRAEGLSPLERWASLVAVVDFAATYLALGLGQDPAISRHVTDLRDRVG